MTEVTDVETVEEEPQSINTEQTVSGESVITATIVHHQGSGKVSDFEKIEEIDAEYQTVRVWYDVSSRDYEDYYGATITQVSP